MNNKNIILFAIAVVILSLLWMYYSSFVSKTRVATLNFPDFMVEKFVRSNNNSWIEIEPLALDDTTKFNRYDAILVRVHGVKMNASHLNSLKKAISSGVAVYATESDNKEINSISGRELEYLATLMDNGSVKNYRSFFNYLRKNIDAKRFFNGSYDEPMIVPADYYFHIGDDQFFATFDEYQEFYVSVGLYKPNAPRVAFLSGNVNMQNSNKEHIVAMVKGLEDKGMNVYPIFSFGEKKLDMIREINPNVIVNSPHGRLLMVGSDKGTDVLKDLNVPILSPVTVSELLEKWEESAQGMAAGGMTTMSIVLPELDGAIAPFAVAAQREKNKMKIFDEIPVHTNKFAAMAANFAKLQRTPNSAKRVAIYYYKGAGKGTLSAQGIEGVNSLYNTLKMLRANGYNVEGLPSNVNEFEAMLHAQGSVLGPYALGAYNKFLRVGNPSLVHVDTFNSWCNEILPDRLIADMKAQYGDAPGEYMATEKEGEGYIAVAKLQFGNVVVLPQPMASVGDNMEVIIHGVDGAPAYPYVASYMWTRKDFKADALVHFGTHGSLEFIPGKQVALSEYDWTDALVGDMPHFYIYTINNIGEGIIAKRRSYATLVSHLTAPFMRADLYDNFEILRNQISSYDLLEESNVKQNHRVAITELAKKENILSTLGLDTSIVLNDDQINAVETYIDEIDGAKVNDGLYTLGKAYSADNLDNTTRLMSIDPIRYSLGLIDMARGNVTAKQLDDASSIAKHYDKRTNTIISKLLKGANADDIFTSLVSRSEKALLDSTENAKAKMKAMREDMMSKAMAAMAVKDTVKFFDNEGNLISKDGSPVKKHASGGHPSWIPKTGKMPKEVKDMMAMKNKNQNDSAKSEHAKKESSMMSKMAQTKSQKKPNAEKDQLINALRTLEHALANVTFIRKNLYNSTSNEQLALINALNGGYIEPSSAGDPVQNPEAVPTGRNFYAINPETTPSAEAWREGKRLADNLLAQELKRNGHHPEKVSFTLWSSDFISSEGATIAQILHLLGVEPLRDGFGYIRSLRLIPSQELGRPRIDVVVQTSGQLRDIAASRLKLINDAITMAAEAEDDGDNFVRKGFEDAERILLSKGYSPADARKLSRERIFGGAGGNYGTGITSMVMDSESWTEQSEIAKQYLKNMGAIYSANGEEGWGDMHEGVFEAALQNTSVVVQPRSSNTWGALSLDHVYEFMGGLSTTVHHVTGNDPTAYFNDFRNANRSRVQELKEAIGVESSSTVFNPKYIKEMMNEEASAMAHFAEVVSNTFGWNAMKPSAIDQHIWNKYYDVYVKDEYDLGIEDEFRKDNPYALQELSAVMLESARKGMWKASKEQIETLADLHTDLVKEFEAGCSGFICDNAALREFITENAPSENISEYQRNVDLARNVQIETPSEDNVVLKKEEIADKQQKNVQSPEQKKKTNTIIFIALGLILAAALIYILRKKR